MPRTICAWTLGPSRLHGIGVFATRDLKRQTRLGTVHIRDLGPLERFVSLPFTGQIIRGQVRAITGGFPFWYLNYGRPGNVELREDGELLTSADLIGGDELLLPLPLD